MNNIIPLPLSDNKQKEIYLRKIEALKVEAKERASSCKTQRVQHEIIYYVGVLEGIRTTIIEATSMFDYSHCYRVAEMIMADIDDLETSDFPGEYRKI